MKTKEQIEEMANYEGNEGFLWADKKLKEKNPAVAYEFGVKAGFKLGYEQAQKDAMEREDRMVEWLNNISHCENCECGHCSSTIEEFEKELGIE